MKNLAIVILILATSISSVAGTACADFSITNSAGHTQVISLQPTKERIGKGSKLTTVSQIEKYAGLTLEVASMTVSKIAKGMKTYRATLTAQPDSSLAIIDGNDANPEIFTSCNVR